MTSANQPTNKTQPAANESARSASDVEGKIDFTKLTPRQVADIHRKADTDLRPESIHHTLGYTSQQAFPGDGSRRILKGLTATGSIAAYNRGTMKQVLNALKALGLDDQTTG